MSGVERKRGDGRRLTRLIAKNRTRYSAIRCTACCWGGRRLKSPIRWATVEDACSVGRTLIVTAAARQCVGARVDSATGWSMVSPHREAEAAIMQQFLDAAAKQLRP